jgi:hypothetical protein
LRDPASGREMAAHVEQLRRREKRVNQKEGALQIVRLRLPNVEPIDDKRAILMSPLASYWWDLPCLLPLASVLGRRR